VKLSFAGTPELAAVVLQALLDSPQHQVLQVYTQPDRPAGRGRKTRPGPVKELAQRYAVPVRQPVTPAQLAQDAHLADVEALIVVAYGMIVPAAVLSRPRRGCINVHASLLPRWRGAAPIQRALQAGDAHTGISIMLMDAGIDTGAVLLQKACAIDPADTGSSLAARLATLGADCLLDALAALDAGSSKPQAQDDALATYAHKVTKQEAGIDWGLPAAQIERNVRAFNPAPVAHTRLHNVKLRVWQAQTLAAGTVHGNAGQIIAYGPQGLDVGTGDHPLRILRLQLEGKKQQGIKEIYNGYPDLFVSHR